MGSMIVRNFRFDGRRGLVALPAALFCAAALSLSATAADIRQFAVGLDVDELPGEGYVGFACGNNGEHPGKEIAGWHAFAECPADSQGLYEVAFEYDDSDVPYEDYEGTQIAGHEVLISLLFSDAGVVEAIRVFTNPFARAYEKRRARLLGTKVMARFGITGWSCVKDEPGPGEGDIAGYFVKERCQKDLGDRTVDLFTRFYRSFAGSGEEIVNSTWFEIRRNDTAP
jgi:hypothetical protein